MPEMVCKETKIKQGCILIFSCSCFLEKAVLGENPCGSRSQHTSSLWKNSPAATSLGTLEHSQLP